MATHLSTQVLDVDSAAAAKLGGVALERLISGASTVEPPCGERSAESDSEQEAEEDGDAEQEEHKAERDAMLSVCLALVVMLFALAAWLLLPPAVSSALMGFAVLEVVWFSHGPSHLIPAGMSGLVLLPCFLSAWVVFLACQTPQL
uniref:Uncharacterized protein n=1 Tax=Alexandrium monilatum TaxID=311494 RepID=A0A7S4UV93_9DINO|mmetsp:Transcript_80600/g.240247  ORF Transcript_80600/g.240247 Transcript_80600/m.240247 type:complete len:146 (-) Transcript_80600:176-613(-)